MIKNRATAIILRDHKILLIQRQKDKHEFYVFPGGTVEECETSETAVIREVIEETSLKVNLVKLIYCGWISDILNEYFYLCEYISGIPYLSDNAIERKRMSNPNDYMPMWISIDQLSTLEIYPCDITEQLIQDIKAGFSNNDIKNIELIKTKMMFKSKFQTD